MMMQCRPAPAPASELALIVNLFGTFATNYKNTSQRLDDFIMTGKSLTIFLLNRNPSKPH